MKKIILILCLFLFTYTANAATYVFTAYDSNFYSEKDPAVASAGELTGVSDIYYVYDVKNQTVQTSQTEWIADGAGGELVASYSPSVFNYSDITFDNIKSVFGTLMPDFIYDDLKQQFDILLSQDVSEQYKAGFVSKHTKSLYNININLIDNRFDRTMPSIKDLGQIYNINKVSFWQNGLYNYSKQNGLSGFSDNTVGFSIGADKYINNNFMLGIGYSFNNSDIKSSAANIESDGHNLYLYGNYKFGKKYINGILNYGFADYTEEYATELMKITGDHNVSNYGVVLKTGYELSNKIRPEIGIRYLHISPDSYTNSIGGKITPEDTNALTMVSGIKYNHDINKLSLKIKLNLTYDVINQDEVITTNIYGYQQRIIEDNFNPFGIESGIALEKIFGRFNISLGYDIAIRSGYQSHTGMIRAKYCF